MLNKLALILLIIGGIAWGLLGAFNFNLISNFFGDGAITNYIYIAVGISAILAIRRI